MRKSVYGPGNSNGATTDEAQAWPVILLIIGALVRDAASIQRVGLPLW